MTRLNAASRALCALLACIVAALLASCAQNEPQLASAALAGKIRNWQGDSAALSAYVYDENGERVLATGSVNDEGSFSLVLPEAPSPELLETLVAEEIGCDGLNMSVAEANLLFLPELEASREGEPLGRVFQASTGASGYGPPARGTVFAARLYSDRAFSAMGSCTNDFFEMTLEVALNLSAGWNQVYAEITESSDRALTVKLGSGQLPPSVDWYITHAPAPPPADMWGPDIVYFGAEPLSSGDLTVSFSWEAYSADGGLLSCRLYPGDGSADYEITDCEGEYSVDHRYLEPGEYLAELWVSDEEGRETTADIMVAVGLEE